MIKYILYYFKAKFLSLQPGAILHLAIPHLKASQWQFAFAFYNFLAFLFVFFPQQDFRW